MPPTVDGQSLIVGALSSFGGLFLCAANRFNPANANFMGGTGEQDERG